MIPIFKGNTFLRPIYTRLRCERSGISAEIAIYSKQTQKAPILPKDEIYAHGYGRLLVDTTTRRGNILTVSASDPLAHHTRWWFCTTLSSSGTWLNRKDVLWVLSDIFTEMIPANILDAWGISVPSLPGSGKTFSVSARYDRVFDLYSAIVNEHVPETRLKITPPTLATPKTTYTPEYVSSTTPPKRIVVPFSIEYDFHPIFPNQCIVATSGFGPARNVQIHPPTIENPYQIYTSAPYSKWPEDEAIQNIDAAKTKTNTTVLMATKYVPSDLLPADMIQIGEIEGRVQSIEHTSSVRGDISYITIGGAMPSIAGQFAAVNIANQSIRQ